MSKKSSKSSIGKLGKYFISLAVVVAVLGTVFFIKRRNSIASQNIQNTESENVVTDVATGNGGLQIIDASETLNEAALSENLEKIDEEISNAVEDSDSSSDFFTLNSEGEIESILLGSDFAADVVPGNPELKPVIDKITENYEQKVEEQKPAQNQQKKIDENKFYYSKDDVALYIYTYKKLPKNFVTKSQAEKLGWTAGTPVSNYGEGLVIGGDRFYNREKVLPTKSGRNYTECDIDSLGKKNRGAKRIVFSNDGLIYYTGNHYESFDLLYGEE